MERVADVFPYKNASCFVKCAARLVSKEHLPEHYRFLGNWASGRGIESDTDAAKG